MAIVLLSADKPFSEYEHLLEYANCERVSKIKSIKSDKEKSVLLLSHLLAKKIVSDELDIPFSHVEFSFNEHGKPCVKRDNYHFSISHSGNMIAFVSNLLPIGIDIQQTDNTHAFSAMRFFTKNEQDYIASDPKCFFEIWTKKEAYIKMLGTGLSTPLSGFDVLKEPVKDMLFSTCFDTFCLSICAENISKINTQIKYV
ncbi:MAG: 4'-phosphopantetheinyl transferase superfamily protein [Clostridia bacterium]|nr:4'-phosphopantetheinyl transferase superfamily protein [Clostridia bacterium]